MHEWEYKCRDGIGIEIDRGEGFEAFAKGLKSVHGGHMKKNSQIWHVLRALYHGDVIDDYRRRPKNDKGYEVHNVRSRVPELREDWNISIGSRVIEGTRNTKEYCLDMRPYTVRRKCVHGVSA
ncbi:hypothetical protein [Sulfurovum mangrovi]|uniref:hypothetical protein n=1 Tax=Sulfurovum mangrovi TaxID=2893889 RepID=UPI001E2C8E5A|nr:hypothetical protein [Sulfurovum mangrovi]UFH59820.1 hypothetical protein LN246_03005 [Sulfurovum mangrovi]UFH59871.1 hypothetical protein LN246_03265 [Sulfurovum mangrovi]